MLTDTDKNEIVNPIQEGAITYEDTNKEDVPSSSIPLASSPLSGPEPAISPLCYRSPSSPTNDSPYNDVESAGEISTGTNMAIGQCGESAQASSLDDGYSKSSLDFHQLSTESEEASHASCSRIRHGPKKMLQRSNAMRDDCSPPPIMLEPYSSYQSHMGSNNSLTVDGQCGGFRRAGINSYSRQGSSENSSIQSRISPESAYTDVSGINMGEFLAMTFNKSRKDRTMLLEIEQELIKLVEEQGKNFHRFQPSSTYQRMLIHRCAAYFGLGHSSDQSGSGILITREPHTRIPPYRFIELGSHSNEKKSILQRDFGSLEDSHYKDYRCMSARRTKSLEEREEAYEKAKKRIFKPDMMSSYGNIEGMSRRYPDESAWFLSHRGRCTDFNRMRNMRSMRGESFENQDTLNVKAFRPHVVKSNSFGGYSDPGYYHLSRGNSVVSNPPMRTPQKQDSMSRYSDYSNSSGYKTLRQDTSSTNISNTLSETPSPTTGNTSFTQHAGCWGNEQDTVMWAVTDMDAVPTGAVLINPQNGQPYVNTDGTPYRFDPSNPPPMGKPPLYTKCNQSKDRDLKTRTYDSKQELAENVECEVYRSCKKHSESVDTTDEKSIKSEEESSPSQSSITRRCLDSAQSVSELRGQLSVLRVGDNPSDCSTDVQAASVVPLQHARPMYPQSICYTPQQPVKHYYQQHAGAVDAAGQTVAMPPVGIGMMSHPTAAHVPSTDGSSAYFPGNFAFVSLLGTPNNPVAAQEAVASQMFCAMPPPALHGPVAPPSSLPVQYSVATSSANSCNIVPYWHGVSNSPVYQPAAGLQGYPGHMFGSPAAAQPLPTPPPIHPGPQGTVIPAGYTTVPASAPSQYVMVPQANAHNFVRPPMQVQSPPPYPVFPCGSMQGSLPPCPNPPFKPFMSASPHDPFVAVKDGQELKPYPGPGLHIYPPNQAHYGGQSYATSVTRPRYMQS